MCLEMEVKGNPDPCLINPLPLVGIIVGIIIFRS